MNTSPNGLRRPERIGTGKVLRLTPELVRQIEQVLSDVGEYGEVHLIVQRGELRYINAVHSHRATGTLE